LAAAFFGAAFFAAERFVPDFFTAFFEADFFVIRHILPQMRVISHSIFNK
jgi:hypothetical protein